MENSGTPPVHYAGFWIRCVADLIDSTLLDIVAAVIELMALGSVYWVSRLLGKSQLESSGSLLGGFDPFLLQAVFFGIRIVLSIGYYTWGHFRYGTTLGKKGFGIKVVSANGFEPLSLKQSTVRTFGYAASYLPMGAGFLMAAFHPEKKALHDVIAHTVSILKPKAQTQAG